MSLRNKIHVFPSYSLWEFSNSLWEFNNEPSFCNWVAVRRTYVFTLQEVEKICRTFQSHMMLVSEQLPVSDHKLPFFRRSFHKSHKGFQCMIKIFVGGGGRGGGWEGGSGGRCLKWGSGVRDLSKNISKQGVGKGKSCS